VDRQPLPAWLIYLLLAVALLLSQILFLWLDGGLQAVEILPIVVYNAWLTPFALALIHFLDAQALTALNATKPILDMTGAEFDDFQYRLPNMPFPAPLAAGLTMLLAVVLMEQISNLPLRYAALEQLPLFAVVFHLADKLSAFLFGVLIYHTVRQLRMVNTINAKYTRISLFNLGPLQACSRLTASTAVGLVVGVYGWMLINPDLWADPVSLVFAGLFTILTAAAFVWPLFGTHRRMEAEKARALYELDRHLDAAFSEFNRRLRDEDHPALERLNGIISSLEIQHRRIASIPTWPWRPETAQFVLAAIALPLILTILQVLAEQAFGW
jgi:hypothetical protein